MQQQDTGQRYSGTPDSPGADYVTAAGARCGLPVVPERIFPPTVDPERASLIRPIDKKWVNGTVLHYYFFNDPQNDGEERLVNGTPTFVPWTTVPAEEQVVVDAFKIWEDIGIGLDFERVADRSEAEIRIGFMRGDGAWSYIGRDVLTAVGQGHRTMNFGWDLRAQGEIDTAIHEIGHTLGFPHEHQNPNAGIVWNEPAVYAELAGPPNYWPQAKTYHNIIKKIDPDTVQGSNWDPNSIMHYEFGPGLILEPAQYQNGIDPAGGLSQRDTTWVKSFYPPLSPQGYPQLVPFQSVALNVTAGQQANFTISPQETRYHDMSTFGVSDTVMVLFEDEGGNLRYLAGDDDSGQDYNAHIRIKLFKGRKYVLRIRLFYSNRSGGMSVMLW